MNKPCINYIERRRDGSYLIDYYDGNSYRHCIYYFYSKLGALRKLRQELGIKRNPFAIRDYTVSR